MAYMLYGTCFGCQRLFASNPERVPSYDNQPICRTCITVVNEHRAKNGLATWPIMPGAYEPAEEIGD